MIQCFLKIHESFRSGTGETLDSVFSKAQENTHLPLNLLTDFLVLPQVCQGKVYLSMLHCPNHLSPVCSRRFFKINMTLILIPLARPGRWINIIQLLLSEMCVVCWHHQTRTPWPNNIPHYKENVTPDILKAAQYYIFSKNETEVLFDQLSLPTWIEHYALKNIRPSLFKEKAEFRESCDTGTLMVVAIVPIPRCALESAGECIWDASEPPQTHWIISNKTQASEFGKHAFSKRFWWTTPFGNLSSESEWPQHPD